MTEPFVVELPCAACGAAGGRVELVPPGRRPAASSEWPADVRDEWERRREPGRWHLLYRGIDSGNGFGTPVDDTRAAAVRVAFRRPWTYAGIRSAGFFDDAGWCVACDVPYCRTHWHVSSTGFGTCPRGHGRSLDPHWHPPDDDDPGLS